MIDCVLAKNFEFVVAGFQIEKVRTCVDLGCVHMSAPVKIEPDRFVLKSAVSKILRHLDTYHLIFRMRWHLKV